MTTTTLNKNKICIRVDLGAILDQYLGKEALKELILEEGIVFDNDLP